MNAGSAQNVWAATNAVPQPPALSTVATVAVSMIRRAPSQPRKHFDDNALAELADSIRHNGLIQPLVVRRAGNSYELIAGERRWRACQLAGVEEVAVVVRDLDDDQAFAIALVENIQREDLNPVEEALGYQRLIDEFGYTQKSVAQAVGKSRSAVANAVRLLKLPDAVLAYIAGGDLSCGHARSLIGLPPQQAVQRAKTMVEHKCTVREAEAMAREPMMTLAQAKRLRDGPEPRYRTGESVEKVSQELSEFLQTTVKLKDRRGKGRIEIEYSDYETLQAVLTRILG